MTGSQRARVVLSLLVLLIIIVDINCFNGFSYLKKRRLPSKLWLTDSRKSMSLQDVLHQYKFDKRRISIYNDQFPLAAEVYINGTSSLAWIVKVQEQGITVQFHDGSQESVDFGQITTVWIDEDPDILKKYHSKSINYNLEQALEKMYYSYVGRARSSTNTLTKKQLTRIIDQIEDVPLDTASHVLRSVIKTGTGYSRLVDSKIAADVLFGAQRRKIHEDTRVRAAQALSIDSSTGGRFKRWPCVVINKERDHHGEICGLDLINGGWLVVDRSVRLGTDAHKFVERIENNKLGKGITMADDRILRRLECLAMGQLFSNKQSQPDKIELDVKETLRSMDKDLSPEGARLALITAGYWSGNEDFSVMQPWSKEILDAANTFVAAQTERVQDSTRVDLTRLPVVCIDEKKTAFRDDAIGIRKRSSTGRAVVPEASQYELLIHITDFSMIYGSHNDDLNRQRQFLQEAAKSRGFSRYDLPLGPLHLLPPVVLKEFSIETHRDFHDCVTVWVYIDERYGTILEAGVERTCIGAPTCLSYELAEALISQTINIPEKLRPTRAVLLKAEQLLSTWSSQRRRNNKTAHERKHKMLDRERKANMARNASFSISRAHQIVDDALDLYSLSVHDLLKRSNAPIPFSAGAQITQGGRVATAPLRRYIDAQTQRQVLAVACRHGSPLTLEECRAAGRVANESRAKFARIRANK